jgi:hypothetical protein
MLADQPHQVAGDAPPHREVNDDHPVSWEPAGIRTVRYDSRDGAGLRDYVMTQHAGPAGIGSEQGGQDPDRGGLAGGIGLLRQQAVLCSAPGYLSTAAF